MSLNFALIGAAGYIAPRHFKAIKDTGNRLVAVTDPHDSVGILDRFFLDAKYFPEIERFDRFLEKSRRGPAENRVHYISVCSPNYLHDAHIRMALRVGADVICEKPIVISPWNLEALEELEKETGRRINTVLQLRVHPVFLALKEKLDAARGGKADVVLTYITGRGSWYDISWKGSEDKSGGLLCNIGIHFFDILIWLFGRPVAVELHMKDAKRMAGFMELERARVRWFLSVNFSDLPFRAEAGSKTTYRSIVIDGKELEFSDGFADLHTRVYEKTIAGEGFGVADARPSIELVYKIMMAKAEERSDNIHPSFSAGVK